MPANEFVYEKAFDRNLGWLTEEQQAKLKSSLVAIAGVGGAGGYQAQALARLGVGAFRIADLDTFDMTNMNRQMGATMSTIGVDKCEVMRQMILDINPQAKVEVFSKGINPENITAFLDGVDVALDGIDLYEIEVKRLFFRHTRLKGIPSLTCAPMGFGATMIMFSPTGMSFDEYFDFSDKLDPTQKILTMIAGLNPNPFCLKYLDRSRVLNPKQRRGASVCPGLMLVGALSSTETVKMLTGKAKVDYAPHIYQFDMFTQQVNQRYYPLGMKSPLQRLKRMIYSLTLKTE